MYNTRATDCSYSDSLQIYRRRTYIELYNIYYNIQPHMFLRYKEGLRKSQYKSLRYILLKIVRTKCECVRARVCVFVSNMKYRRHSYSARI